MKLIVVTAKQCASVNLNDLNGLIQTLHSDEHNSEGFQEPSTGTFTTRLNNLRPNT